MVNISELGEESLRAALDHAMKDGGQEAPLRDEEARKFREAFKDEEFRKMFGEYMQEISDPKYRKEQEAYITQLEGENRVPQGKQLVRPSKGMVVKTSYCGENSGSKEKMFINIVVSEKIAPPKFQKESGGMTMTLPTASGGMHLEKDSKGQDTTTFDVCVHPEALLKAKASDNFKDFLVTTAMEQVEKQYAGASSGSEIAVSRTFHILKGVSYKSGDPATMLMALESSAQGLTGTGAGKTPKQSTQPAGNAGGEIPAKPQGKSLPQKQQQQQQQQQQHRGVKEVGEVSRVAQVGGGQEAAAKVKLAGATMQPRESPGKPATPAKQRFTITERGVFDMADHMHEGSNQVQQAFRPKELVIRIMLPAGTKNAAGLDLDVAERRLLLGTPKEQRYVDIKLPYPVHEKQGAAKFDKASAVLTVTVPVQPPPRLPSTAALDATAKELVEATEPADRAEEGRECPAWRRDEPEPAPNSRWVTEVPQGETFSFEPPPAPPVEVGQPKEGKGAGMEEDELVVQGNYTACECFAGPRPGYVFKLGDSGLGYYKDAVAEEEVEEEAEAAVQHREPRFEWRENERSVSVIVDVENVPQESIKACWGKQSLDLAFSALEEGLAYRLQLALAGEILPDSCKCDAATENICVLMYKKERRVWGQLVEAKPEAESETKAEEGGRVEPPVPVQQLGAGGEGSAPKKAMAFKSKLMYELD